MAIITYQICFRLTIPNPNPNPNPSPNPKNKMSTIITLFVRSSENAS